MRILLHTFIFLFIASPSFATSIKDRYLDIQEVRSPLGISAWLVEDHSVPVISINFAFAGAGAARDPEGKSGTAQLLSNTLDEGAGNLDSQSFQKALADHSISLTFNSSRDDFYGTVRCLVRHCDRAFELLHLALTAPRFDAEPLERMKDANIARIRTDMSDPDWQAARIMNDIVYKGHVYARNSGGTISSLRSITADDLRAHIKSNFSADRLKVSVSGDIKASDLSPLLDRIFNGLQPTASGGEITDISLQGGGKVFLFKNDNPQTVILAAQTGLARSDPDWYAAQIMNFILGGGGFGSRLTEEVREKRGLTYGIFTGLSYLDHAASLTLQTSTANDRSAEVLSLIKAEWVRMRDTDVTDAELMDAKSYISGSIPLSLTSTGNISGMVLSMMLDGLPPTYLDELSAKISDVTKDDIRRVAQRLLKPDEMTIVLVGNPVEIAPVQTIGQLPNVE